ncbi:MAG TPA: polyribonucleotide nucleotidyltransferase [Bacteroidia bacterium]|nr:polyribonucleotide nucleotidyltransferase [Bacteroidia bacterium]
MSKTAITKTMDLGDGRTITLETGKLAKQANGSVVLRMGDTMLLATVVSNKDAKPDTDFLPLSVDYQEKYASAGRFPGGFFKREARLSEYEILISRLVDRALRPLFPDDYHADTQVLISLISLDKEVLPDCLAGFAASAAITISDIPFNGPISEVRVARIDGKFVVNPTRTELAKADMEIIVAASEKDINMVEGEMKECSEAEMLEAMKIAHEAIKKQCQLQKELAKMVNADKKREYCHEQSDADLKAAIHKACFDKVYAVAKTGNPNKSERKELFEAIKTEFLSTLSEEEQAEKKFLIKKYFHDTEKDGVRAAVLTERTRLDGRKLEQIRPIWSEVDYLPTAHGSAIFTRGETQSLTTVTLGTKLDIQIIDGVVHEGTSKLLLHYNFPPFSTGEVKPMRGTGRREVGHGNLALRALKPMLPEENPYTIRIVSDILESNGSSSMATVCAGTLALMDAGVQLKKPVAGIAMGLISDSKTGKYAILSDILGDEDHLGDMDFKVTGTKDGITACQMDIKVDGLSYEVLEKALEQAKAGRIHILGELAKTIQQPREDYKPHAPRIVKIKIPKEFIGAIIGPGGKVIQEMQRETETKIVIEEEGEFGIIDIVSDNKANIDRALAKIKAIASVPEVGEIYEGKVKSILAFGAFIEFMPSKDGLLHISEVEWRRLDSMEGILKEGDIVKVKLIGVDPKTGKFKLSRKALLPKPEKQEQE